MASSPEERRRAGVAERVRDPGYTPGIRDLGALLDLLAAEDEDLTRAAERAILRIEAQNAPRLLRETVERAGPSVRPARGRIARLLGRLVAAELPDAAASEGAAARAWLTAALGDVDPKTRHTAARALGKVRGATADERRAIETALLAAWDAANGDDDRRALADALGKIGSQAARERLQASRSAPAVAQRATRAALMIDRTAAREKPGAVALERAAETPVVIRFHTRVGLEPILVEELGDAWRPRVAAPGLVDGRLVGPLARAAAVRTALEFGVALDALPVRDDLATTVATAIMSSRTLAVLRTYTETGDAPIRFRIAWARGGHRRALTWRIAELVAASTTELVNDPTASTWEVIVDDDDTRVAIELVPRGFDDMRFAYRKEVVPASSHPTIAAALVRLAPMRDDDVVWDPFVGAGAELVERALRGPYASLLGTDLERSAVEAARANVAAAGVARATLEVADGTTYDPRGVTVIVTNPPMGRRVQRGAHLELLERFVDHAARVLVPNGSLVWAAPEPQRLHLRAERAGLVLERSLTVDMGGFPAELSVHRKRVARERRGGRG